MLVVERNVSFLNGQRAHVGMAAPGVIVRCCCVPWGARLAANPLAGMAVLAMDETNAPELRRRMYTELAQHLYPKRHAIESPPEEKQQVIFQIGIDPEQRGTRALQSTEIDAAA